MKTDVELEGVGVLLMIQGEDDMVLLVGVAPGDELGRGNAAAAFLVIWVKVALVVMGEVQVSIFLAALAPDSGACFGEMGGWLEGNLLPVGGDEWVLKFCFFGIGLLMGEVALKRVLFSKKASCSSWQNPSKDLMVVLLGELEV